MHNFTAIDLVQTSLATLAFALFLLPPGYLLGLATNLFGMRSAPAAEKLLFSAAFSIAATPILAVLLTRATSFTVTLVFFLLLALVALLTLIRQMPAPSRMLSGIRRSSWLALGMMLAWFLVVQLSLADIQIGNRLYINFVAFDHSLRVPLVAAAARWGVPPRNPFYGLGEPPVLRYFYYWYVVCALPVRLFGLSPKGCLDASVFWSGVGLASLIPLYLRHFCGETENLRGKSLMGIALLAVTGLDILPYLGQVWYYHTLLADIEWWDTNQVTSWMGSLLWVPHHVASLTACMAGILVLATIREGAPWTRNAMAAAVAGAAFASTAGLSVYVAFPLVLFAAAWTLITLVQKRLQTFLAYLATGAFSLLLSYPYIGDLLSKPVSTDLGTAASAPANSAERFAYFSIREYLPALDFLSRAGVHNPVLLDLSKVVVLPFIYALEFGFFGVILILCWRRDWRLSRTRSENGRMGWWMLGICLLAMSFLKSETTGWNDLGWRGMLVVQFVLLVWAAPIAYDLIISRKYLKSNMLVSKWTRWILLGTLAGGVLGTAVQLTVLRFYAPLAEHGDLRRAEAFLGAGDFAQRTYWMREGYTRLNELTSAAATVQYNPVRDDVLIAHLYLGRQAAMGDPGCMSTFGGDPAKCQQAAPYFNAIFNQPGVLNGFQLDRICDVYRVNVLVAEELDPVWRDPQSWVWTRPALYANRDLRAIPCGSPPSSAAGAP